MQHFMPGLSNTSTEPFEKSPGKPLIPGTMHGGGGVFQFMGGNGSVQFSYLRIGYVQEHIVLTCLHLSCSCSYLFLDFKCET